MLITKESQTYCTFTIISLFLLNACVTTTHKPSTPFIENGFDIGSSVNIVTLLPIIDNRSNKKNGETYVKEKLIKEVETELMFKGYEVAVVAEFNRDIETILEGIINMNENTLAILGPVDCEYLFLFLLNDSKYSNAGIGASASISATGRLIDKQNRRLVWEGKCLETETMAMGGAATMVTPVIELSMKYCFQTMFSEFPQKVD